ncbi:MAG: hypothetical protein ACI30M_02560 [Muribaculaceae bacterium]
MVNSSYTVQILEPSEGKWLKQKSVTEIKDITFSKKVFLAVTDKSENWEEVSDEYKLEIEKQQKELFEKEEEERKKTEHNNE